jgi:hypothetical protein
MHNQPTTEIVIFKLNPGVDEAAFLQAAEAIMPNIRTLPGFMDRQLLKGEQGQWLDIVHWQSREDALKAAEIFPTLECTHSFITLIDAASMTMLHLEPARAW